MPYKCSVKGCRSNYDSTNEKVSVFQFPSDTTQKTEWLQNINLNSKLTNSSRVCIKHFSQNDIEVTDRRSLLKPLAVPRTENESSTDFKIEFNEIFDDISEKDETNESDRINGFTEFCLGLEEIQGNIIENWNIYNHQEGICFYRLSNQGEDFSDIKFSFQILVNKLMRVKLYSNEKEATCEELKWALRNCHLQKWSQLERILVNYYQKPEVLITVNPMKHLLKAFEALELVRHVELQSHVDTVKAQIISLYQIAKLLPDIQEEDFYMKPTVGEKIDLVESNEHDMCSEEFYEDFLEEEIAHDPELDNHPVSDAVYTYQENDEIAIETEEDEPLIEYEKSLKCKNCFMTLQSELGLQAHQKSCYKPTTNVKIDIRKSKLPRTVNLTKTEVNVCDVCQKPFRTVKSLKEHMILHKVANRQKCPICDLILFPGVMQRHIRAVHNKIKPYSCITCGKSFSTSTLKNDHEKTHSKNLAIQQYLVTIEGMPRYACPKCTTSYETSTLLKKHIEKNCRLAEKKRIYRYPCVKCAKNFTTKIQAAQHLLNVHKVEIGNLEKYCFECNDEFDDYVNHVRFHSCSFACRFCGSKFLTQEKAINHEHAKHSSETIEDRPFKCNEENCRLSFKNVNHLRSHHQAIHTQLQREFKCNQCEKKFGLRAHLTVHIRQHYASFPCNFGECDRRFKKLNNLKGHLEREHGITKIYLCKCGARFKMLNLLKNHSENEHGVAINIQKYFENQ